VKWGWRGCGCSPCWGPLAGEAAFFSVSASIVGAATWLYRHVECSCFCVSVLSSRDCTVHWLEAVDGVGVVGCCVLYLLICRCYFVVWPGRCIRANSGLGRELCVEPPASSCSPWVVYRGGTLLSFDYSLQQEVRCWGCHRGEGGAFHSWLVGHIPHLPQWAGCVISVRPCPNTPLPCICVACVGCVGCWPVIAPCGPMRQRCCGRGCAQSVMYVLLHICRLVRHACVRACLPARPPGGYIPAAT
jgi:hypothetical protein